MHALEVKGSAPATMSTETQQHCPAVCGVVPHTMLPVSLMAQVVHTLCVHASSAAGGRPEIMGWQEVFCVTQI